MSKKESSVKKETKSETAENDKKSEGAKEDLTKKPESVATE